jgi:hypothetical protein
MTFNKEFFKWYFLRGKIMFSQRKIIRNFINHLIQGLPESVNPNYKYIFFFKDKINGFAFIFLIILL